MGEPIYAATSSTPLAETRLAVHVARLYVRDDLPKNAIATQLGLSRFKVARLIDRPRAEGLVTIHFVSPDGIDRQLSARLADTLGLAKVLVADPVRRPSVAITGLKTEGADRGLHRRAGGAGVRRAHRGRARRTGRRARADRRQRYRQPTTD